MSMSTPVPFRDDMDIPICVCPEKPLYDPYSNFFFFNFPSKRPFPIRQHVLFILSFLLQYFTSFVIDFKNKKYNIIFIMINEPHRHFPSYSVTTTFYEGPIWDPCDNVVK